MDIGDNSNPDPQQASESAGITIRLEAFEGPLDLLLHLIKTEEIDIWNIPIAHITEQYLEYLQIMKDLNINLAGEWLMMAATLIYIKSRMLVPQEPAPDAPDEEEEDPRKELVYQLLEHQKFKNAAEMLYTAEPFDAHRARQIGFVTHLTAEGTDIDTAVGIGEKIAVNAPFGVSQTKNLLNAALGIEELRQHMTTEIRAQVLCSLTDDVGEGVSAALQRRAPTFSNS